VMQLKSSFIFNHAKHQQNQPFYALRGVMG
jgi:hypothetical protein